MTAKKKAIELANKFVSKSVFAFLCVIKICLSPLEDIQA